MLSDNNATVVLQGAVFTPLLFMEILEVRVYFLV